MSLSLLCGEKFTAQISAQWWYLDGCAGTCTEQQIGYSHCRTYSRCVNKLGHGRFQRAWLDFYTRLHLPFSGAFFNTRHLWNTIVAQVDAFVPSRNLAQFTGLFRSVPRFDPTLNRSICKTWTQHDISLGFEHLFVIDLNQVLMRKGSGNMMWFGKLDQWMKRKYKCMMWIFVTLKFN